MGALRARAEMLARLRRFFAERGVLEVDTPYLSAGANTDPQLNNLAAAAGPDRVRRWLHTSPEFPMKRLLAAGSGPIYQVCHVFRGGEAGCLHNPEFTLLEWYRPGFNHNDLMREVAELVSALLADQAPASEARQLTYQETFLRHAGIDPLQCARGELLQALRSHGYRAATDDLSRDQCLDFLMGTAVAPELGTDHLCFVTDYPASQAALARIRLGPPPVAERFELFWRGVELANGYHELRDPVEQRRRFERENARRRATGLEALPLDENLLAALQSGLPPCAGVALGLDRLLMLKLGRDRLDQVMAFPRARA